MFGGEKMEKYDKEKSALIIGAGGLGCGIAESIKKRFPEKRIYLVDKKKPNLDCDSDYCFIQVDLAQDNFSEIYNLDIDMLIITAGIGRLSEFKTFNDTEIEKNFAINTISVIKIIRAYYSNLLSNDNFYAAVITSIAGHIASPFYSIYSASKAALSKFIEAINAELRYARSNNCILEVAPGRIDGTGFHGTPCTPERSKYIQYITSEIVDAMLEKREIYIPNFENIYLPVIKSYQNDPKQFADNSVNYKLKSNEFNNNPQIKTGYLTGTFDLFHVGHLNLIKNAKKYCDRLIVGVHPDAKHKNKEVFIPLEERLAIVKSIRYVDDAIVCSSEDTDAYESIKYDYLFVGSDYKGTDRFNKYEKFFEDKGVQIIYLPYTQSTNSTYLRSLIIDRLSNK